VRDVWTAPTSFVYAINCFLLIVGILKYAFIFLLYLPYLSLGTRIDTVLATVVVNVKDVKEPLGGIHQ
jgi:hypothetical protein